MDMSFWNYVLYRRAIKAAKERKAKFCFALVGVVSVFCLVVTYVATM